MKKTVAVLLTIRTEGDERRGVESAEDWDAALRKIEGMTKGFLGPDTWVEFHDEEEPPRRIHVYGNAGFAEACEYGYSGATTRSTCDCKVCTSIRMENP